MREQLYDRLTLKEYNAYARLYADTGFSPRPLQYALAQHTTLLASINTKKGGKQPRIHDYLFPRPIDRRTQEEKMDDLESGLNAMMGDGDAA